MRNSVKDFSRVGNLFGDLFETSFDADDDTLAQLEARGLQLDEADRALLATAEASVVRTRQLAGNRGRTAAGAPMRASA